MAMPFNDTTNKLGLIQDIEIALFGDNGYGKISGNANLLAQFTARINRRQDDFIRMVMTVDGIWAYDDTNDTDYSIFTADIVTGQRDYPFDVNMIEIDKVAIKNAATGIWNVIPGGSIQDPSAFTFIENNTGNVGVPFRYYKWGNSIWLDPNPIYTTTGNSGIRVYAHRGANYFVSTDTIKVPGFAAPFHKYLSRGAAFDYAKDRAMTAKIEILGLEMNTLEDSIEDFFNKRNRDVQKALRPTPRSSR